MKKKAPEGLRDIKLLSGLSDEGLAKFAGIFGRVSLREGEFVFMEGDAGDSMYIVEQGQVVIEKKRESGREKLKGLAMMGRGDFFGEMAVLEGQPRFAQARAAKDTLLFQVNRERLFRFIRECPEDGATLLLELIRAILRRLRRVSGELLDAHGFMEVLVKLRRR